MVTGITESTGFQIATRTRFLRRAVNTAGNVARMDEMFSQMGDMLKKDNLMPERDVVEQNEVLVKLTHVTNMRNYRNAKFLAQQTDGNKFAHSGDSHRVHLDVSHAPGLQVILENDPVRNMFAKGQLRRRERLGQCLVAEHVIRMRRLFDPKWINRG